MLLPPSVHPPEQEVYERPNAFIPAAQHVHKVESNPEGGGHIGGTHRLHHLL